MLNRIPTKDNVVRRHLFVNYNVFGKFWLAVSGWLGILMDSLQNLA